MIKPFAILGVLKAIICNKLYYLTDNTFLYVNICMYKR